MTATIEHSSRFEPWGIEYRKPPQPLGDPPLGPEVSFSPERAEPGQRQTDTGLLADENAIAEEQRELDQRERQAREEHQARVTEHQEKVQAAREAQEAHSQQVRGARQEFIEGVLPDGFRTRQEVDQALEESTQQVRHLRERYQTLIEQRDATNPSNEQYDELSEQAYGVSNALRLAENWRAVDLAKARVFRAAEELRGGWERGISEKEKSRLIEELNEARQSVGSSFQRVNVSAASNLRELRGMEALNRLQRDTPADPQPISARGQEAQLDAAIEESWNARHTDTVPPDADTTTPDASDNLALDPGVQQEGGQQDPDATGQGDEQQTATAGPQKPTPFTGQVHIGADGDPNPVEYANQQLGEANDAADAATEASHRASMVYGEEALGEIRDTLATYRRLGIDPLESTRDRGVKFMIDFDAEDGEGSEARYTSNINRADIWRQHFNAEVARVNDAHEPLERIVHHIETLQASGRQVYADSPEWQRYVDTKAAYDEAVRLSALRLGIVHQDPEKRFEALKSHVADVNAKVAAAGAPEAYQTYLTERSEAETALKAAEGWQQPLSATAQPSDPGVGYTMSEGVAPATHRLVETPEGLPSLAVRIEQEQQPASGDGYTMSEAIRGGNLNDAVLDEERGLYVHPTTRETWKQAEVDQHRELIAALEADGYKLDPKTGKYVKPALDESGLALTQPDASVSQFQMSAGPALNPDETETFSTGGMAANETASQRPNAALMAGFYGNLGNFSEQYRNLRSELENRPVTGRHFGLDPVIEQRPGFCGAGKGRGRPRRPGRYQRRRDIDA